RMRSNGQAFEPTPETDTRNLRSRRKIVPASRRNQQAGSLCSPDTDPPLPPRRRTSSVIFIERKRLLEEASRRGIRAQFRDQIGRASCRERVSISVVA